MPEIPDCMRPAASTFQMEPTPDNLQAEFGGSKGSLIRGAHFEPGLSFLQNTPNTFGHLHVAALSGGLEASKLMETALRKLMETFEAEFRQMKAREAARLERVKKSVEAHRAWHLEAEKNDQIHDFTIHWIGCSPLYETDRVPWALPPREYLRGLNNYFGVRSSRQDYKVQKDYNGGTETIIQDNWPLTGDGDSGYQAMEYEYEESKKLQSQLMARDPEPNINLYAIDAKFQLCRDMLYMHRDLANPVDCLSKTDFFFVKEGDVEAASDLTIGTGFYRAPEILNHIKGSPSTRLKAQCYSFAVTCYRAAKSCEILWGSLLRRYNAIRDHESKIYYGTKNGPSYFEMDEEERLRNMLPPVFDFEWCKTMEAFLEAKPGEVQSDECTSLSNSEDVPCGDDEEEDSCESAVSEVEDSTADSYVPQTEPTYTDKETIDASATLRNVVEDMVRPLITALRTRVEEEQKHRQEVLAAEMDNVALMLQDIRHVMDHSNEARGKDRAELLSQQISVAAGGKRKSDMEVDREAKKQARGNAGRCDLLLHNT